jgi:hypothetical protein
LVLRSVTRKLSVLCRFRATSAVYLALVVVLHWDIQRQSALDDEIGTVAQSVSFGINSLLAIDSLVTFQPRPRARSLGNQWIAGFRQVYNTIIKVYRKSPAQSFRGRMLPTPRLPAGARNHLHDRPARCFRCGERDHTFTYVAL